MVEYHQEREEERGTNGRINQAGNLLALKERKDPVVSAHYSVNQETVKSIDRSQKHCL